MNINDLPENDTVQRLTPEEAILGMFTVLEQEKLPLNKILELASIAGSPDDEVTQGVLANMVEFRILEWERDADSDEVYFSKVEIDPGEYN